jgi:ZIP family zinc transporter
MENMLIGLGIATFVSVFLGGLLAIQLQKHLHLILGFGAGAILGVAFFDLIPESIEIAGASHDMYTITGVMALGFIAYMILDRTFLVHGHHHEAGAGSVHRGSIGAGSLAAHTFLDGIAVGLAFQASTTLGLIVTAAILTHTFADGINTVNMIFKNGGSRVLAYRWLFVDAIAPGVGMLVAYFFVLPEASVGLLLALFSGFFLYVGASDLLPESYHAHPKMLTTVMTILGIGVLFVVVKVAGV